MKKHLTDDLDTNSFKKIISLSGVNFIFRIFGLGTSFLITILITRFFGIATFGSYSLVFAVSQVFAIFFTLGIPNTIIKIVGSNNFNYAQAKALLVKGLVASIVFSVIPFLIFYLGSEYFSQNIFQNIELKNYFLGCASAIPLLIVHEIMLNFFIASKNFKMYNIFMFVMPNILLTLFVCLLYVLNKEGYYTFIAFAAAIFITVFVEVICIFDFHSSSEIISITIIDLLKTSSPVLFSGLFLYLLNYINVIMLGLMTDEIQVGIYNIAYKVGGVGFLIIISVSTIITPQIAELYGLQKQLELKKVIHNSTKLITVLSIPIVLVLIVFSKNILSIWGIDTAAGSFTLIIVSLGVLFSATAGNVDQILNMTDNQHILKNITVVSFFINLVLSYYFIPLYGIEGAAFSSLLSNIFINILCLYYIKKKLGFYSLF